MIAGGAQVDAGVERRDTRAHRSSRTPRRPSSATNPSPSPTPARRCGGGAARDPSPSNSVPTSTTPAIAGRYVWRSIRPSIETMPGTCRTGTSRRAHDALTRPRPAVPHRPHLAVAREVGDVDARFVRQHAAAADGGPAGEPARHARSFVDLHVDRRRPGFRRQVDDTRVRHAGNRFDAPRRAFEVFARQRLVRVEMRDRLDHFLPYAFQALEGDGVVARLAGLVPRREGTAQIVLQEAQLGQLAPGGRRVGTLFCGRDQAPFGGVAVTVARNLHLLVDERPARRGIRRTDARREAFCCAGGAGPAASATETAGGSRSRPPRMPASTTRVMPLMPPSRRSTRRAE